MTEEYFASSKMTGRGQITLPKKVQEVLGIRLGNYVLFYRERDKIYIKKGMIKPEQ